MRPFLPIILLIPWALFGCKSAADTVTEGNRKQEVVTGAAAGRIVIVLSNGNAVDDAEARRLAEHIVWLSDERRKQWGDPKEMPVDSAGKLVTAATHTDEIIGAGKAATEQAKKESEGLGFWTLIGGTALSIGTGLIGMALRSTGLGSIPFVGGLLARITGPRLAQGATVNEKLAIGLQEGIGFAEEKFDENKAKAIEVMVAKGIPKEAAEGLLLGGKDIVKTIVNHLAYRNLGAANDAIYKAHVKS